MSRVRADQYTNSNANGAPLFPDGLRVTGVVTTGSVTATSGSFFWRCIYWWYYNI